MNFCGKRKLNDSNYDQKFSEQNCIHKPSFPQTSLKFSDFFAFIGKNFNTLDHDKKNHVQYSQNYILVNNLEPLSMET